MFSTLLTSLSLPAIVLEKSETVNFAEKGGGGGGERAGDQRNELMNVVKTVSNMETVSGTWKLSATF